MPWIYAIQVNSLMLFTYVCRVTPSSSSFLLTLNIRWVVRNYSRNNFFSKANSFVVNSKFLYFYFCPRISIPSLPLLLLTLSPSMRTFPFIHIACPSLISSLPVVGGRNLVIREPRKIRANTLVIMPIVADRTSSCNEKSEHALRLEVTVRRIEESCREWHIWSTNGLGTCSSASRPITPPLLALKRHNLARSCLTFPWMAVIRMACEF